MFYPTITVADRAENAAREARTDVELFRHDIDRLLLITQAMWTLMKQEHGYADDALTKMVEQLEVERAKANPLTAKDAPVACPNCGKLNSAKRPFCIYCGKPIAMTNPFAR